MSDGQTHTPITGHFSPETAYVVEDYPYGFTLRCKIRYWIEFKPSHGFRFVSQTSNPKKTGLVWNKPKAGTYCKFGAVMLRGDENGYISYTAMTQYCDAEEFRSWFDRYSQFLSEEGRKDVESWLKAKELYSVKKADGFYSSQAALVAVALKHGMKVDSDNNITDPSNGATVNVSAVEKDPTCAICERGEEPGHDH